MIAVRPYDGAESETLLNIFTRSVREIASRDYSPAQIAAWAPETCDLQAFAARLAAKSTFIAEAEGCAAGFCDLEDDGHIDLFFVHPDFQGRGVGWALMAHIQSRARSMGLSRLYAEVSITARPFFERSGFQVLAEQTVEVRGQTFRNYRMEKRVSFTAAD